MARLVIRHNKDISRVKENTIIGSPELDNTIIEFYGINNYIICDAGVSIMNSHIKFRGNNAVLFLKSSSHAYYLNVDLWHETSLSFGKNCYFNGLLNVIVSEHQSVFVGDDCLFSFGIWIRTADPHLIYSCDTKRRLNDSRSILIGDHVWIGQDAMLLKGTVIGSGSIIAAKSVVAGKSIPSNTCWGGNPVRCISQRVFFCSDSVHAYSKKQSAASHISKTDSFIYDEEGGFLQELPKRIVSSSSPEQKASNLTSIYSNGAHNRFSITARMHNSAPAHFLARIQDFKPNILKVLIHKIKSKLINSHKVSPTG